MPTQRIRGGPGQASLPLARTLRCALWMLVAAAFGGWTCSGDEESVVELTPLTVAAWRDAAGHVDPRGTMQESLSAALPGGGGSLPTLASHLAGLPGVVAQEAFGGFDPPRITLRGSGLQSAPMSRGVWWTLDGFPLNATDGAFNSAVIEPALATRLAIARTTISPIAAPAALGGEISLSSPRPDDSNHAWFAAGPDGYRRAGVATAIVHDRIDHGWFGASYAATDGWRRHSAQNRIAVGGGLVTRLYRHGPYLSLRIFGANPRLDIPGPLTLAAARNDPASVTTVTETDHPRRETEYARLTIDATWRHDTGAFSRLALGMQHTSDWFRQLRANGISDTRGDDLTALLETQQHHGVHTMHAGLMARAGFRDQQRWTNLAGIAGNQFGDVSLDAGQVVAWFDDRWEIAPRLAMTGGVSLVDATRDVRGATTTARGSSHDRLTVPRIGLSWQARDSFGLFTRAARGVEPPTFDDLLAVRGAPSALTLAWTPLRAQHADTIEIGINGDIWSASERREQNTFAAGAEPGPPGSGKRGHAEGGRPASRSASPEVSPSRGQRQVSYSCTFYEARWRSELLRLADENGAALGTVNASSTRHRGVETAVRWSVLTQSDRSLDLTLSHTWSEATFETAGRYRGNRIAGLPPHAGTAQLAWSVDHGLFGIAGVSWIAGKTYVDHANQLGYSGHAVVHARAGWRHRDGWSVFVEVDNLFDRAHIASTAGVIDLARNPSATGLFLPGSPRLWRVGLTWQR